MTSQQVQLIFGMALVTYLPRVLPMLVLSNRSVPEKISKWMSFVPVSIFAALIFSDVFFWESQFNVNPIVNIKLLPSVLVFIVAYKTKSLLWSMVLGIAAIALMVYLV
ncbi:MAG: AzlD domain-containing protein [Carnobacterium inhibens]|jgi:branched-subunit amino acid transport protein|uniref:AzlD domain-containing protein n=1 Tax=Carnobacterium inhibens TaxID=147709 RepID=A0ABR7T976_9LACT|nr:AzlD domain-containing protein [Carnobacterium inhibens]MBC9824355.1 AzlD domain-containing protein [Carnobacterium inhibens]